MDQQMDETLRNSRHAIARSRGRRYGGGSDRERLRQLRRMRRRETWRRRLRFMGLGFATVLIGAIIFGAVVHPLGFFGTMLVFLLLAAVLVSAFSVRAPRPQEPAKFASGDLAQLPRQTELWLESQRPALPAPAQSLIDQIGVRLDTLTPQLAGLNAQAPVAADLRALMGEQLPELVAGFRRIPKPLQGQAQHEGGLSPEEQLIDGLNLIETQLADASLSIARGDLDRLATHQRYLELKYRDGTESS